MNDRSKGLSQLKEKLNAFDAYLNNTHWLISDIDDWSENMRLFDYTYEIMAYVDQSILQHCLDKWFENKVLKMELCSSNFMASHTETIEVLSLINGYKKYLQELNQKKSIIWDEIILRN